jgi:chromatin structure-remodeling complex subunit RSC1/2
MSTVNSYTPSAAQVQSQSQPQSTPYLAHQAVHTTAPFNTTPAQGFPAAAAQQLYNRATALQGVSQPYSTAQNSVAPERRLPEAYVLSDTANESIPKDIRDQFPQDDQGRVLFFTQPPIDTRHMVTARTTADKGEPLVHSEKYLEAQESRLKAIAERKRNAQLNNAASRENRHKRLRLNHFGEERDTDGRIKVNLAAHTERREHEEAESRKVAEEASRIQMRALKKLADDMMRSTVNDYLFRYGDQALKYFDEDHLRVTQRAEDERQREMTTPTLSPEDAIIADTRRMLSQDKWTGRFADGSGRFEDDYDNRLPK